MSNYWYTLTNRHSTKQKCHSGQRIVTGITSEDNVISTVLNRLLDTEREERLDRLLSGFDKDKVINVNGLRECLPVQYKQYADDLCKLKESMCSLYEISQMYKVSDIEIAPNCIGCLYDCNGQRDHMECPTGCLHERNLCLICTDK